MPGTHGKSARGADLPLIETDQPPGSEATRYDDTLPRDPESAGLARQMVTKAMAAWDLADLSADARLVMSELVTNTLDHAQGSCIRVHVTRIQDYGVRIAVDDRDHTRPEPRRTDWTQERGRGLYLVDAMSAVWGVDPMPWGKRVWAELHNETRKRQHAVASWLLSAARDKRRAVKEWDTDGMALLQCGTLFCAIRLPVPLVEAASPRTDPATVDAFLAEALYGAPVIRCNTGQWFYALVSPSAAERWTAPYTECLGPGYDIGVPRPDLTEHPGRTASYWAVPMSGPGALGSAAAVSQLTAYARFRQAQEEAS
ncbi:ATP-binding protein [Streptomyces sp. NPDC001795]|uniref:ATP-binding protein n=1 Tax=Streptomyces sp. NPDC001795 TaxID=3154525 RepID=UPI00332AA88A